MKPSYETLVGSIYDSAANPDLWPDTLSHIRDAADAAYVQVGFCDAVVAPQSHPATWIRRNSPWDQTWLDQFNSYNGKIPCGENLSDLPVDVSWTQLKQMPEDEFQKSDFYHEWVKPQNLRDFLSINYIKSEGRKGVLSMPTSAKRDPICDADCSLAEQLSPHIRRAMLINDLTGQGNLSAILYRQVLDSLSVAVFIVGRGRRLAFTNAMGEKLLSSGDKLSSAGGLFHATHAGRESSALEHAIERALQGDVAISKAGVGVPLIGDEGERAVAYVLPLAGTDVRGEFGPGHCAVFVAGRGDCQPMGLQILRTMFDLTASEARIALLIAKGDGPQLISQALGIKVNTVRTHLKHSFAKVDVPDQTALAGRINAFLPPIL